jgi:ABC-type transport system involved in multi-copper enzyme maturation permease subunit
MSARTIPARRADAGAEPGPGGRGPGWPVHAEWTKFRTVRGWVIGVILAVLLTVLVGVFAAGSAQIACGSPGGGQHTGKACEPRVPVGPGGEAVTDSFFFVHQPLAGNGSITARLTALTGAYAAGNQAPGNGSGPVLTPGLMPWSKAGIIIKQSLRQGSAYAAMLATGRHGVRMQWDYTHDTAGRPGRVSAAAPRWLRLTRSGDTITGYDSADGRHWTAVGTAALAGLPATVQVGMFATSPGYVQTATSFGGQHVQGGPSEATGVFDDVRLSGAPAGGSWAATAVGGGGGLAARASGSGASRGFRSPGGSFTLTGSGDIAPVVPGPGSGYPSATIEQSLAGAFIGLMVIVVVAAMFFTAEYRRGLIRTTLAATPRRGAVLAAKAVVIGAVAFAAGLVASVVAVALGVPRERNEGLVVLPVPVLTEVRVIVGTAALLAVAAIFAVALGAILRRSAAAIAIGIVALVLPFLLSALSVLPSGPSAWLLRLTPAAGLAIQQSIPNYPQVTGAVSVAGGSYPLPPWAGFAVLCGWAAAALALAFVLLRRRDA